jgi:hypothetical protein
VRSRFRPISRRSARCSRKAGEHDRLERREDLDWRSAPVDPATQVAAFMASGLRTRDAPNRPGEPVFFVDLDGVNVVAAAAFARLVVPRASGGTARIRPVSAHPIDRSTARASASTPRLPTS